MTNVTNVTKVEKMIEDLNRWIDTSGSRVSPKNNAGLLNKFSNMGCCNVTQDENGDVTGVTLKVSDKPFNEGPWKLILFVRVENGEFSKVIAREGAGFSYNKVDADLDNIGRALTGWAKRYAHNKKCAKFYGHNAWA